MFKFRLPPEWEKRKQEIYEKQYVIYNGEEVHVTKFEDQTITPEMYEDMRMNSYARDEVFPKLTDETLLKAAKTYLSHCTRPRFPCITYDEALVNKIVPELIKRLEEK